MELNDIKQSKAIEIIQGGTPLSIKVIEGIQLESLTSSENQYT